MQSTIGIVTVVVGDQYLSRLPRWAESIAALERQPDDIIIVTNDITSSHLMELPEILPAFRVMHSDTKWVHHPQILANDGIRNLNTEWVCKLDADDALLPHAFNALDECEADIYMFGLTINGEYEMVPALVTSEQVLKSTYNPLFAASPFRKSIWERTPGFQDMVYDDWAFWRQAARQHATFAASTRADYVYHLYGENASVKCDHETEQKRVWDY